MNKPYEGGLLISKIHQLSGRIFLKKLKKHKLDEINPAQGRILFVLKQKDGMNIQELSRRTSLDKSTLTSMLDRLERQQFIHRSADKNDRRKIIVRLSSKIKSIAKQYTAVSQDMLSLFYSGFEEDEIVRFEDNLRKILENLEFEINIKKGVSYDGK
jgi:DNA-binding MarR family transcriptional regulator